MRMKATASIMIHRPIDEVFGFVSTLENMDRWVSGASATTKTNDDEGVGARYESEYTYSGRTADMTFEVTEFDVPTRFVVSAPSGPFAFSQRIDLEETDGGTSLTTTIDAGADSRATAVIFTVFRPLIRRLMARQLKAELGELKAILEGEAARPESVPESTAAKA